MNFEELAEGWDGVVSIEYLSLEDKVQIESITGDHIATFTAGDHAKDFTIIDDFITKVLKLKQLTTLDKVQKKLESLGFERKETEISFRHPIGDVTVQRTPNGFTVHYNSRFTGLILATEQDVVSWWDLFKKSSVIIHDGKVEGSEAGSQHEETSNGAKDDQNPVGIPDELWELCRKARYNF